jgi:hypothetical protein
MQSRRVTCNQHSVILVSRSGLKANDHHHSNSNRRVLLTRTDGSHIISHRPTEDHRQTSSTVSLIRHMGNSPISRMDNPVSRMDNPISRTDNPVSRMDNPISRMDNPTSNMEARTVK